MGGLEVPEIKFPAVGNVLCPLPLLGPEGTLKTPPLPTSPCLSLSSHFLLTAHFDITMGNA